jgi:hypothetical protein
MKLCGLLCVTCWRGSVNAPVNLCKLNVTYTPIPAVTTSVARSHASTPADPIRYDFPSDATVKQAGQSDHTVRRASSNMTWAELSITNVTWHSQPILNKRTAFDPCLSAGVPTMDFHDTRDLYCPAPGRCNWWSHSLKIKYLLVIFSGRQRVAR